jgi:hypothetical protein
LETLETTRLAALEPAVAAAEAAPSGHGGTRPSDAERAEPRPHAPWPCPQCTLDNGADARFCLACGGACPGLEADDRALAETFHERWAQSTMLPSKKRRPDIRSHFQVNPGSPEAKRLR